jgi:hypothetical protein
MSGANLLSSSLTEEMFTFDAASPNEADTSCTSKSGARAFTSFNRSQTFYFSHHTNSF